MPYTTIAPISKQLTIVLGLIVVGFMSFALCLSFYNDVLYRRDVELFREGNDAIRMANRDIYNDILYYSSPLYRDKIYKENMRLIQPGERALLLGADVVEAIEDTNDKKQATGNTEDELRYEEYLRQTPVIDHWKLLLFEPSAIERLEERLR